MSQLWAIVAGDGSFVLRFTASNAAHPAQSGHADECEGCAVWPLARDPRLSLGEGIDPESGAFDFDLARVEAALIASIKTEAARRIESIAPLWRQINDLAEPQAVDASERRAAIDEIRAWSNQAEAMLAEAVDADDLETVLQSIAAGWPETSP